MNHDVIRGPSGCVFEPTPTCDDEPGRFISLCLAVTALAGAVTAAVTAFVTIKQAMIFDYESEDEDEQEPMGTDSEAYED